MAAGIGCVHAAEKVPLEREIKDWIIAGKEEERAGRTFLLDLIGVHGTVLEEIYIAGKTGTTVVDQHSARAGGSFDNK
ncbi:MAG: hypothetical protein EOO38_09650, partial [Cytophagaceae bacterium]